MPNIASKESQIIRKGDDPVADEAVQKIKRLWKILEKSLEKSLESRFEIGKYLIEYFYEGNIENAQKNKFAPNKKNSFANMLKHEDLPTQCKSAMAMSNFVYSAAVYEGLIKRGFPLKDHIKSKKITYTHFVILSRLKKTIQVEDKKYKILDFDTIEEYADWVIENELSTSDLQNRVAYYNSEFDDDKVLEDIPHLFEINSQLLAPLDARFLSDWEKFAAYDGTSRENYIIPDRVNEMKGQIVETIKNYNAAIAHLRTALTRIENKKMIDRWKEEKDEESSMIIDEPEGVLVDEPESEPKTKP